MRADLRAAAYAERDVAVIGFEAREPGLEVAVIVDDRTVGAASLEFVATSSRGKSMLPVAVRTRSRSNEEFVAVDATAQRFDDIPCRRRC